jgi:type I restriction enzyme S subunit
MKNELRLPSKWQMKTLGDLFEITSSKRVFKEDWKSEGVPFYRAREIVKLAENGFVNNELFISEEMFKEYSEKYGLPKAGDIMVTGVGTLGICYVVKGDDRFYFKDGNIIWLKSNGKANSRYVEYAFKSDFLRKQIDDSVGAVVGTYTIIKAKSTRIPLPPLPEQQRIVSILDECFAAIDKAKTNAEQNLKNAKELFESYLQGVFEKTGDGWEVRKVKDIGLTQTGTTPKTLEKKNYGDFIPFIKPADVDFSGIGDIRYDNEGLSEIGLINGRKMESGSILMVCIGATIGKVGFTEREVSCNQQINSLTVKKEFEPKFIYYAMRSKKFQQKVLLEGKGAQATLPIINKSKWENLTLSYPESRLDQLSIVRNLDALQAETKRLEELYQKKIENLEELKKSILEKALRGELETEKLEWV